MADYTRARYLTNESINFRMFTEEQRARIYYAGLEILERTGAKMFSQEALDILKKGGAWVDGEHVRIPIGLSEWAVRTAPSQILLWDREGEIRLVLEGCNTYFGPGPTNTYHIDPFTEERRRPVLKDTENVAKVCDALPNIDFVQDLGTPTGVTTNLADVYAFSAMVKNTRKPIVHWGFDIDQYRDMLDIAAAVRGSMEDVQKRPFLTLYSEPSPPLMHSDEAIGKAIFAAKNKIPIVYTPCNMAGATDPATLAGCLAMGVAESVVGIVVTQLIREGTPIIMGGVYGIMDMNTTVYSYGSPEFMQMQAGIAEVAHYMNVPVFGTAGCTDSHTLDAQAAAEAAMSILIACEAGANLVHDSGYIAFGGAGSTFQLVMADEIIGMVRRIIKGMEVNEETLALFDIDRVGPSGEFLTSMHTHKHFKSETWFPTLMNRMRYSEWKEVAGATTMGDRIKDKTRKLIKEHEVPSLPDKVLKEIDAILKKAEEREARKASAKKKK